MQNEQTIQSLKRDSGISLFERPTWIALPSLMAMTLALFSDVLLSGGETVVSSSGTDTFRYFVHWRNFGFNELRQGNLALWNPYIYGGAPFLGGFQAGLLYPLNWMFLVLPLGVALNGSVALHVFLAGAFTYLWTRNRGLHPLACFLAAVIFMFGGPYFLHVYAGHLPNLCTMIWAPLLFLAIDKWFEDSSIGAVLLGNFAVAMMVLAGHPQYVFYTAIAAALYCGLNPKTWRSSRTAFGLILIAAGGALLSAAQLFAGIDESREILRSVGLHYDEAAMFSFPPENVLTLLAPWFFGNLQDAPYWGRCFLWEMNLFLGVSGFVLALYGVMTRKSREKWISLILIGILLVLALGAHTPLFHLLYSYVPGFNKFRGSSKFIFLVALFGAMFAAVGLDKILREKIVPRKLILACGAASVVIGLAALVIYATPLSSPDHWWSRMLERIAATQESYLIESFYTDFEAVARSKSQAAQSLGIAAGTLAVLTLLFYGIGFKPRWINGIAVLAILELLVFARSSLSKFPLADAFASSAEQRLTNNPGDYRIAYLPNPNLGMSIGIEDVSGDDPSVLLRYAQFLAFTQGLDPDKVQQLIPVRKRHSLLQLLRCRFLFPSADNDSRVIELPKFLPRFLLVGKARVVPERDAIFAALAANDFNPFEEVILEQTPHPQPDASGQSGAIRVLHSSTDHFTIEVEVPSPAILLMTDSYAKGWRAVSLARSVQKNYKILPANYCLRAIPLERGEHHLRIEYSPRGFQIGKWVSLAALSFYAAAFIYWIKRRGKPGSHSLSFSADK